MYKRCKMTVVIALVLLVFVANIVPENKTELAGDFNTTSTLGLAKHIFENVPASILSTPTNNSVVPVALSNDAAEELDSVILINSDGSMTLKQYEVNIKYVDEQNNIRFKNNALVKSTDDRYLYENADSDIKMYFPDDIRDGIRIVNKQNSIAIAPNTDTKSAVFKSVTINNEICLQYNDVFGKGTALQYLPVNTGLKEYIILYEYGGVNTFEFVLEMPNYVPLQSEGKSIEFYNEITNTVEAFIVPIDARDSYVGNSECTYHQTLENYMQIESIGNKRYLLKVIIDKDFLENESTVYPVVIDPTTSITQTAQYDSSVYSGYPSANNSEYLSPYNPVGYHNDTKLEAKAVIGFNMNSFATIDAESVTNAYYHVREGSGKTNTMHLNVYALKTNWSSATVSWNDVQSMSKTLITSGLLVNNNTWLDIDLTETVQQWINYVKTNGYIGINPANGILLESTTTNNSSKHFASSDYSGSLAPSLVVEYNNNAHGLTYNPQKYNFDAVPLGDRFFQGRMNCYGYALQIYYKGSEAYAYKQQPGEFKQTETFESLIESYKNASDSWDCLNLFVRDRINEDFARFGWTLTSTTATAVTPAGKRKIALVVSREMDESNGTYFGDYHFYARNSDGTWSHKQGLMEVSNLSIDTKVVLTDSNISTRATEGGYDHRSVLFFFIDKDALVYDYSHGYGQNPSTIGTPVYWETD